MLFFQATLHLQLQTVTPRTFPPRAPSATPPFLASNCGVKLRRFPTGPEPTLPGREEPDPTGPRATGGKQPWTGRNGPTRGFFWGFRGGFGSGGHGGETARPAHGVGAERRPAANGVSSCRDPKKGRIGGFRSKRLPPGAEAAPSRRSSSRAGNTPRLRWSNSPWCWGRKEGGKPQSAARGDGERHHSRIPAPAGETPPPRGRRLRRWGGAQSPF